MARFSIYLNFQNQTEVAFNFYKKIFGTEFEGDGISRFGEAPQEPGQPELTDEQKKLVMHVSLPLFEGYVLMGSDVPEFMGQVKPGNNVYVNLELDSRKELERLFKELSEGGKVEMEPQEMFWGDYFATCKDKFGVGWMFVTISKE